MRPVSAKSGRKMVDSVKDQTPVDSVLPADGRLPESTPIMCLGGPLVSNALRRICPLTFCSPDTGAAGVMGGAVVMSPGMFCYTPAAPPKAESEELGNG